MLRGALRWSRRSSGGVDVSDETIIEMHEWGTARGDIPDGNCTWCRERIKAGHGWKRVEAQGKEELRHTTPLYFDECADQETRRALKRMGFCITPIQTGVADTVWLAEAGRKGWTVITADKRIMEVPDERQAVLDNEVRCFILSPQPSGSWETVRAFVTMWEKVRLESAFPGPAVWKIDDTSPISRWEQLVPDPVKYKPFDFSKTPVGHLLNLFADVVTQHDKGWWTKDFVNRLHDEIRVELESRIAGLRVVTRAASPDQESKNLMDLKLEGEIPETIDLDDPIDLEEFRMIILEATLEHGLRYQWIAPARTIPVVAAGSSDPRNAVSLNFWPTGFHRSGVGMSLSESAG